MCVIFMLCVLFVLLHKLLFILVCNFIFNLEVYYLIPNCMISMKTKKIICKTEKCPPSVCSCALLILIRCCCYLTSHPFPLHRPGVISNCNSGFFQRQSTNFETSLRSREHLLYPRYRLGFPRVVP